MALAQLQKLNKKPLRKSDSFDILKEIGHGSQSTVFMGRDKTTGEIVAMKNIEFATEEEIPEEYFWEMTILQSLDHPNVIKLKEIVISAAGKQFNGNVYLVFEYMDHDLAGLICAHGREFTIPQLKCYMRQLLDGLNYCHVENVIHRDIKGSNLLVNNEGTLKIADFGLAIFCPINPEHERLSSLVGTLPYRAPEMLLGSERYSVAADMWSIGCVFAELLLKVTIFDRKTAAEQINRIFEICGSPDETNWPNVSELPLYESYKPSRPMPRRVKETYKSLVHGDAFDLLDKLLIIDPSKRLDALEARKHDYFLNEPLPCDPESLPKYKSSRFEDIRKRKLQQDEEAVKKQKQETPKKMVQSCQGSNQEPVDEPQQQNKPAASV